MTLLPFGTWRNCLQSSDSADFAPGTSTIAVGLLSSLREKTPIKILWKDPGPVPEQG